MQKYTFKFHQSVSDTRESPRFLTALFLTFFLFVTPQVLGQATESGRYEILFMGNSHSAYHDLPDLLATLIEAGIPGTAADADLAPGYRFLVDRLNDGVSLEKLDSREWTHVVLQAQKYSTTGRYYYPTDAAEEWIRRVTARNAIPILFPEWPRRGNTEEGPRVHQLHLQIAAREPACVAPIGLAWEQSLARNPSIRLHAADGNHSNSNGALLTAYVLYEVITGHPAARVPYIDELKAGEEVQLKLREVAGSVVLAQQARCTMQPLFVETETFGVPAMTPLGLVTMALVLTAGALLMRK